MKHLNKTAVSLLAIILTAGCDYIPRTVYEIETKNNKTLKLFYPTIDQNYNKVTYLIKDQYITIT